MFNLVSLALVALAAVSAVNGSPIAARATPPPGWISEILEVCLSAAQPFLFTLKLFPAV